MVADTQRSAFASAHYFNPHQCYHQARLRDEIERMYDGEDSIEPKPATTLTSTTAQKSRKSSHHLMEENPFFSLIAAPSPTRKHRACGTTHHHALHKAALPQLEPLTPPATPPLSDFALTRSHSHDTRQAPSHLESVTDLIRQDLNAPIRVQCVVRARIPTSNGAQVFLHVYRNNHDDKEHLAIVFSGARDDILRSRTLDAPRQGETELDRMVRGAYVGRLRPGRSTSAGITMSSDNEKPTTPLVRIHSECFTGETLLSSRCDCGEQLNVALQLMQEETPSLDESTTNPSASAPGSSSFPSSSTQAAGGVVIYLRQEGRGIGLAEKLKAYNLQDLGADTVQANLALGHGADERRYDIARAILRDLSVEKCRLLTNNPDKIEQLTGIQAGDELRADHSLKSPFIVGDGPIQVVERVGMVPKLNVGTGADVDKYIRTKVERMRHMIDVGAMSGGENSRDQRDQGR